MERTPSGLKRAALGRVGKRAVARRADVAGPVPDTLAVSPGVESGPSASQARVVVGRRVVSKVAGSGLAGLCGCLRPGPVVQPTRHVRAPRTVRLLRVARPPLKIRPFTGLRVATDISAWTEQSRC